MRTTVNIDDRLLQQAKQRSLAENRTLGQVIEDALRQVLLAQPKSNAKRSFVPLKTYMGSGLQPGVDLSDSSALMDLMEDR